ncbi:ATP-binding protein [Sphingomonas nostoxanthinifaciens]|uniref:ATP-binding protein n=1 Tax=Sphingomonas nostoxanthinifaciens TaxID=2872652 RepID=UPI001CC20859|nr:ATP-binding protein [Sphingomonas nostoxanthinifaciens]UAK23724.1 ATP-binding protein [Sphingomonas nostoxanthinifaciens]
MTVRIAMGKDSSGADAGLDLEELLATRLLVQGNSGSGKSHLLRRLLEESAPWVQQVIIDPEGDFVSLADEFDHRVIDAAGYGEAEIGGIAGRVRAHRVSVVLNMEGLEVDAQLRCAGAFLNRLFDAPRDQWYPALVVVDEAQLFAPAAAGDVGEEARRVSLAAMTNLMCRGRKRGLAGVIATQRLAKLAKNVAAEASNFLMGRTFLDIDMARAADLLGMERRQAEQIRDLERGQFLALGPALSRRPQLLRIGTVRTGSRGGGPTLAPLPDRSGADTEALLFDGIEQEALPMPAPAPTPPPSLDELFRRPAGPGLAPATLEPEPAESDPAEATALCDAVLGDIVADEDAAHRPAAALYQDFVVRCRMRGAVRPPLLLPAFMRALALARAGLSSADAADSEWAPALAIAERVPEDMLGVFLTLARAAREGLPCPTDPELARVYGTQSLGRLRRLLGYMEAQGLIACRKDFRGRRAIAVPELGCSTAPETEAIATPRDETIGQLL